MEGIDNTKGIDNKILDKLTIKLSVQKMVCY